MAAVILRCAACFSLGHPVHRVYSRSNGLPIAASGQGRTASNLCSLSMQDQSWNLGRFAKTFTSFNGLPFLGPLGKAATVKQPAPVQKGNELVLWSFSDKQQVFSTSPSMPRARGEASLPITALDTSQPY